MLKEQTAETILGAIVAAESPQPVAWLARNMGANRQNVQRIINDLEREGLVTFAPNPHHRRAQLIVQHNLRNAVAVAQIEKNEIAMVAAPVHPTQQDNLSARVRCA